MFLTWFIGGSHLASKEFQRSKWAALPRHAGDAMTKAKKRVAKREKISKRGKESKKPTSKRTAKRSIAKNSLDHDRIVALAARVDQMLWATNADRRKVMWRETLASFLRVIVGGEELAWARSSSGPSSEPSESPCSV